MPGPLTKLTDADKRYYEEKNLDKKMPPKRKSSTPKVDDLPVKRNSSGSNGSNGKKTRKSEPSKGSKKRKSEKSKKKQRKSEPVAYERPVPGPYNKLLSLYLKFYNAVIDANEVLEKAEKKVPDLIEVLKSGKEPQVKDAGGKRVYKMKVPNNELSYEEYVENGETKRRRVYTRNGFKEVRLNFPTLEVDGMVGAPAFKKGAKLRDIEKLSDFGIKFKKTWSRPSKTKNHVMVFSKVESLPVVASSLEAYEKFFDLLDTLLALVESGKIERLYKKSKKIEADMMEYLSAVTMDRKEYISRWKAMKKNLKK